MFRFIRTATISNAADMPVALKFASEITSYVNKQYSLGMKFGAEMFGGATVHWHFDAESLDKLAQLNARMMEDREYIGILDKHRKLWVEGSLKDSIVAFVA